MYKLYSAFIGILITVMLLFNGVLSQRLGNYASAVIIHFTGFLIIGLVLLFKKIKIRFQRKLPVYLYSGGALGVFTILFNNIGFNQLGASLTLALGLLGQSLASIAIDHYGVLGAKAIKFKKEKLLGLVLISAGIIIMTLY